MRVTIEFPDDLHVEIKARAALRGQSMKEFVVGALSDKLAAENENRKNEKCSTATIKETKRSDVDPRI